MRETVASPPLSLAAYQHTFTQYLLTPTVTAAQRTALQSWLPPGVVGEQGLAVYRNNVVYSLTTALAAQFPVVQRLVGHGFFAALAHDFICSAPPTTPALTFYGDVLPEFIASRKDCEPVPYLADVARLELACQYALHAADTAVLQAASLLALPPDQLAGLTLPLHESASLLQSPWPVQRIREENLREEPQLLQLDTTATTQLLVYRRGLDVQIVTLQPVAFLLLQALQHGEPLQQAWDRVQQQCAVAAEELVPLLIYLLQLDVFTQPEGVSA